MSFAQLASHVDGDQMALAAWKEAVPLDTSGGARINEAVALQRLGRHAEALALVESLEPVGPRFHTVLGNVRMDAGLLGAAVEAYRLAVEAEEPFVLPFQSAFDCIDRLGDPSLVPAFIKSLQDRWPESPIRTMLLARAHLLAGRPATAAKLFAEFLIEDGDIISPERVFELVHDPQDISVFTQPSATEHLAFAHAMLRCRDLEGLHHLIETVFRWPRWADGDWRVIKAESARLNGGIAEVAPILDGMVDQIPAQISNALVLLDTETDVHEQNDDGTWSQRDGLYLVETIALGVSRNLKSDGFRHPEGRPDALAFAILSRVRRARGDLAEAEKLGREAVLRDPRCVLARATLVTALMDLGDVDSAVPVLLDGLRRAPSEPRMVRLAVETLVSANRISEAEKILSVQREGLCEYGEETLGYRLGELVAVAKLGSSAPSQSQLDAALKEWPWIDDLESTLKGWMVSAHHCRSRIDELGVALAMYTGKVAEKLLVDRVMVPFKKSLRSRPGQYDDRFRDVNAFLDGGRPPSLGGIARLFRSTSRPMSSADPDVVKAFRIHLRNVAWPGKQLLFDRRFVERLQKLAEVRNESAHVDEPSTQSILRALSLVVAGERPGDVFRALGFQPESASADRCDAN
jgi:tetratricopeptide (TPR) repeat protein